MQVIRRVGLIGDLHAEDEALEFALGELKTLGAETLLQVGDIADGPGDLSRSIALLREAAPGALTYLMDLPVTREFRSPRGHVLLCHGLGTNDMAGVKPDHEGYDITSNTELQQLIMERRYRFVLNGHTHRAMLRTFGPLSIINAGTLLRDGERCFTFIDFERGELVRFRHAAGPLCTDLGAWTQDRQALADSPSEPFREPFV